MQSLVEGDRSNSPVSITEIPQVVGRSSRGHSSRFRFVIAVVVCDGTDGSASVESVVEGAEGFGLGALGAHAVALASIWRTTGR
jgi:hypothetical protein